VFKLTNEIRDYAWGSHTHISRLLGSGTSAGPQAELWIGAHEGDPSRTPSGEPLNRVIADSPDDMLGDRVCTMFGPRLPFLVKALAAAEPLSLQVHPTSERARMGFADQEAAGIPLTAPERSYQDPFHKPELIFALTRFEGMAGFRDTAKSAEILRLLDHPWADEIAWRLESGSAFQTLRAVVTYMLSLSGHDLVCLLAELGDSARRAEERGHREEHRRRPPAKDRASVDRESTRVFAQTSTLTKRYPTDPGVLVTLLLNHVVLAAGEAMFLDAGVIHAYTSGFGVEVMASSDNVVRAVLTLKYVDVPELLAITNFTPIPAPLWGPSAASDGTVRLDPPVPEFRLTVGTTPLTDLPDEGPRIILTLEGSVKVLCSTGSERLTRGESVFLSHADGKLTIDGTGRVVVVSVPA
jgi:mannose-6-phosphate isomerase